jgi:hypothetical protein
MLEGVLGPPTDPAMLRQKHAQPAGRNVDTGLPLQIGRQPLGRPDVEDQAQRGGRRLQGPFHRRQVGGIRPHRPPRPRRVRERVHPALRKARQPVFHPRHRATAPARDALDVVAQGRRLDHLQPFAHPPRQIGPAQLSLHVLTLLRRDGDSHGAVPPRAPPSVRIPGPRSFLQHTPFLRNLPADT